MAGGRPCYRPPGLAPFVAKRPNAVWRFESAAVGRPRRTPVRALPQGGKLLQPGGPNAARPVLLPPSSRVARRRSSHLVPYELLRTPSDGGAVKFLRSVRVAGGRRRGGGKGRAGPRELTGPSGHDV